MPVSQRSNSPKFPAGFIMINSVDISRWGICAWKTEWSTNTYWSSNGSTVMLVVSPTSWYLAGWDNKLSAIVSLLVMASSILFPRNWI